MTNVRPGDPLQAAIDALAPGGALVLSPGDHHLEVPLQLRRGVRLVGAGAEHTRLVRVRTPHACLVEACPPAGETVIFEGLTIAWAEGDEERPGAYLFESDVLIVRGGHVTLRACRLAGSETEHRRSNDMYGGSGLRLTGDAAVRADGCEIVNHGGHGLTLGARAKVVLVNGWVAGNRGSGVLADDDAVVEVDSTVFTENAVGALALYGAAALDLVDAALQANVRFGLRLATTAGARLERCTIEENGGPGVTVGAGRLAFAGGTIRKNRGDGLVIAAGGQVTAKDLIVEANRGFGISQGPGAAVELASCAILHNGRGRLQKEEDRR